MAAPVINTDTSVFAFTRGRYYSVAFTATNTPTSWTIAGGALPDGMSLDTGTGIISGAPNRDSEGSVFKLTLTATNGAAETSAETVFTIGVERPSSEPDGSMDRYRPPHPTCEPSGEQRGGRQRETSDTREER